MSLQAAVSKQRNMFQVQLASKCGLKRSTGHCTSHHEALQLYTGNMFSFPFHRQMNQAAADIFAGNV